MNKEHEKIIRNNIDEKIKNIKLISNTNNLVYEVKLESKNLYAKFYLNNSSHIDHEIKLYKKVDNKYLKKMICYGENPKFAIYEELNGKFVSDLSLDELNENKETIINSLIDFFNEISKNEATGYGILDENLNGKYSDFKSFLIERQKDTSDELKDYLFFANLFNIIYDKYEHYFKADNHLTPIDTNLNNIMITSSGIKFPDPGEIISASILMGYGDFVAHAYKTPLYDELINQLNPSIDELKLIRIYAIFSSLNVLAFCHKNGIENLYDVIPYGNSISFYELIKDHLNYLDINNL